MWGSDDGSGVLGDSIGIKGPENSGTIIGNPDDQDYGSLLRSTVLLLNSEQVIEDIEAITMSRGNRIGCMVRSGITDHDRFFIGRYLVIERSNQRIERILPNGWIDVGDIESYLPARVKCVSRLFERVNGSSINVFSQLSHSAELLRPNLTGSSSIPIGGIKND